MSHAMLKKRLSLLDVPMELPPAPLQDGDVEMPDLPELEACTSLLSPRGQAPRAREVAEAHEQRRQVDALVGGPCVSPSLIRRAAIPPPVAPLREGSTGTLAQERGTYSRGASGRGRGRGMRGRAAPGNTVQREGSLPVAREEGGLQAVAVAAVDSVERSPRARAATSATPACAVPSPVPPIALASITAAAAEAAVDAFVGATVAAPGSPAVVRSTASREVLAQQEQLRHRGRRSYPLVDVARLPHASATRPLQGEKRWTASADHANDPVQYAALYYNRAVKGKTSKRSSKAKLLHVHQSKRLKAPLHALATKELQKHALDVFERLLVFAGDKHEKRLSVSALLQTDPLVSCAQHVLDLCMRNAELRDELYGQLIKQITSNPHEESCTRMQEMLLFTVCTFPPSSADMLQVLWRFLEERQLWFTYQCLQRTCGRSKERTRAPSLLELMFLRERSSLICRFALEDGTQKAVQVDSSSRMAEAFHSFCERVGLAYCWRDLFQPVLVTPDGEEVETPLEAFVSDTLRNCELVLAMSSGALQASFAFRVKVVLFVGLRQRVDDLLVRRLLHHQVAEELRQGKISCVSEEQEVLLAALHTQFSQGDYDEHHTSVAPLVPSSSPGSPRAAEVQVKARRHYLGLMGTPGEECSSRFLATAASLPSFGVRRYVVQAVNASTWGLPPSLGLTVAEEGLVLYCEGFANEKLRVKYEDIVQLTTAPTRPPSLELDLLHRGHGARLVLTSRKLLGLSRSVRGYVQALLRRSPHARALDDHCVDASDASQADLLAFRKDQVLRVLQRSDGNDWEHGELEGRTGNFPLRLVTHVWREDHREMPHFARAHALSPRILASSDSQTRQLCAEAVRLLVTYGEERLRKQPGEEVTAHFLAKTLTHKKRREEPMTMLSDVEARVAREASLLQAKYESHGRLKAAEELLMLCSRSPTLQDELYCQLLAQLFSSAEEEEEEAEAAEGEEEQALRRCWELLVMASTAYNPSHERLCRALEAFLEEEATSPARWVAMLARHAQRQVAARRSKGCARARLPSRRELEAVADRALFLCVPLLTPPALLGSRRILADGCTTAEEVRRDLLAPLSLSPDVVAALGLGLSVEGVVHPLAPSAHIADALADAEELQRRSPGAERRGGGGGGGEGRERREKRTGEGLALVLQVQQWSPALVAALEDSHSSASHSSASPSAAAVVYEVARQEFLAGHLAAPSAVAHRLAVLMFAASALPAPHRDTLELFLPPSLRCPRDAEATVAALASGLGAVAKLDANSAKQYFIATAQEQAFGLHFAARPRGSVLSPRAPLLATALCSRGVTLLEGGQQAAHFSFQQISGKNFTSGYQDQVVQLTVSGREELVTLALYAMDVRAFLHFFQEFQYTYL